MLRMGPRVIDLDILFYGSDVVRINKVDGLDDLVIPHERLQERGFVLKPMCDIAPGILYLFYFIDRLCSSYHQKDNQRNVSCC